MPKPAVCPQCLYGLVKAAYKDTSSRSSRSLGFFLLQGYTHLADKNPFAALSLLGGVVYLFFSEIDLGSKRDV
jgi:hypothetical protein